MHIVRIVSASLSLLASSAIALVASVAHAGESCAQDSDCGHGFACQVVGSTGCAVSACPPGVQCPTPTCDPQEIKECVPGPCNAHSDCADGMVCYEFDIPECSATTVETCDANNKCMVVSGSSNCVTSTSRLCVPRYDLPCTTDASCGDDFKCTQDAAACGCAGSGGTAPSSGSTPGSSGSSSSGVAGGSGTDDPPPSANPTPPPTPAPDCTCTPATTKHCEPKATTCNLDTDCPAHWTCATTGGGTTGSCSGGAERLPDGGFKELPPVCVDDPPTPTTKQCVPPNYGYSSDKGGSLGIPERGSFGVDAGVPIDTGSGSVPPATGSGTGTTGGPVIGQGRVVDDAPGDAPSSNESGGAKSASSDNGGCQIALGSPSTGAGTAAVSVMALLGLAGFARRRRTRWG